MRAYSDPFNTQQTSPISRSLRSILLRSNVKLNWPENYHGLDYLASINEVTPSQNNFSLSLPSALQANVGTSALFVNLGEHAFTLKNFDEVVLTTIGPGEIKYFYCSENDTAAGVWRITTMGSTTHTADAVALAGSGTKASGGKLALAYQVSVTSSNIEVTAEDRAKIIVANGGSSNITLPAHTIGNDFFVGVKNSGSGTMTVSAPAGTIDGSATLELAPNESAMIHCSGTSSWYTVGFGRSTEFQFTKLVKDVSAGGTIALTSAEASNKLMQFIGNPSTDVTIIVPSVVGIYYVQNAFTGPHTLTLKTASGNGVAMSTSDRAIMYCDAVNVTAAQSTAVGTNISIVDGSLAAPSLNFSADPNTGLYRADVDTVGVISDGAEAARFNKSISSVAGRLGVGVQNPSAKFHVVTTGNDEIMRLQGTNSHIGFFQTSGTTRIGYLQFFDNGTTSEMAYGVDFVNGSNSFYVNGTKRAFINSAGLTVNGAMSVSGNVTLGGNITITGSVYKPDNTPLFAGTGNNVFTGIQSMPTQRNKFVSLGNVSGNVNIDLATASSFSCTAVGTINFTFSNKPPANYDQVTYLKIVNGANYPPNFPSGTRYPRGTKPALSNGMDMLAIWYDPELQAHIVGKVWEDFK